MTKIFPGWLIGLVLALVAALGLYAVSGESEPEAATVEAEVRAEPGPGASVTQQGAGDAELAPPGTRRPSRVETVEADTQATRRDTATRELRFQSANTDATDPELPAFCLRFSSPLDPDRAVEDKAFVRVVPDTPFSLDIRDRSLCVLGLDADETYTVRVLPGLTAKNGRELAQSVEQSVAFEPKPSMVGFVGNGIILPRGDGATLGVKAMNTEEARLTLYRVNHRALFQHSPDAGETSLQGNWSSNYEAYNTRVEVHTETLDLSGDTNRLVERAVDLSEIIQGEGPGAYIVDLQQVTDDNARRNARSYRWLYVTDIALAAYRGEDAMHVTARSIESAQTLPNVRVAVIARNNELLAEARTGADGRAVIPGAALRGTGNLAPKMVLGYAGEEDFAALDLSRSPLDLSAFDVAGRDAPGDVEAFIYTERGIYRPGETVHLTALIRNRAGEAAFDRDGTLVITKPDDSELLEARVSPSGMAGALYRSVDIPADAPRGRYTATLTLDGLDDPVGRLVFSVEDFVPEQLRLSLRAGEEPLVPGTVRDIEVVADFLYGASGRDLDAEADARITVDPKPFPDFAGYQFGDATTPYREQFISLDRGRTDEDGTFNAALDVARDSARYGAPLRALVTVGVAEPSGRYVRDSVLIPVRGEEAYVGFKPRFDGGYARRNTPAEIDIIAVGRDGERVAETVTLRLLRERYDYQYTRENGRWRYRRDRRDSVVSASEITIPADQPYTFSRALGYGQYRVEVERDGVVSNYRFGSGWRRADAGSDAPDRMSLGLDAADYAPGDSLALTLNAPFAGVAELVVADGGVRRVETINVREGAQTIRLRTDRDWVGDLYLMATLYGPTTDEAPRRAVGLVHVPRDRSGQTLDVSVDAPAKALPRTTQTVSLAFDPRVRGEAFLTLAAVDTGILQITDYSPPDPVAALFGKRALALDVHDDYARIMAPYQGPDRVGGDVLGGAGLSVVPIDTVSLFRGPIEISGGRASVELELPDFQGELTVMAVAWTRERVGSASTTMVVRDPVTAQLSLPRFLAPGDKAVATLALDNVDGLPGDYASVLSVGGEAFADATLKLEQGERGERAFEIGTDGIGVRTFGLQTRGRQFEVQRDYQIETRSPALPRTVSRIVKLAPGEAETFDMKAEGAPFHDGTIDATMSASFTPFLDTAPLLSSLRRYPYGCTEQTVSVAVPLLLSERLGLLPGQSAAERTDALQAAVDKLLSRQSASGAIGLWYEGDGRASPYLQLYASEFLLDAAEAGYTIPDSAVERTKAAVTTLSELDSAARLDLDYQFGLGGSRPDYELRRAERAAYAHGVLARHDRVKKTEVTYLWERFGERMQDSVALSQLGFALASIGESERAGRAFARAYDTATIEAERNYYNTPVRNAAALLTLADDLSPELSNSAFAMLPSSDPGRLNTHEKAWLLRAAASSGEPTAAVPFDDRDNWVRSGRGSRMTADIVGGELLIRNTHDRDVWLTLTVSGQPTEMEAGRSEGAKLFKSVFGMDGTPIEDGRIARGERAIILLEAEARSSDAAMWVLADLLPAGFEIERIVAPSDAGDSGPFAFLGELNEVDLAEARDDRFVASWRTESGRGYLYQRKRRVAYLVRAVTEGDFAFPGAHLEDMYRPSRMASTDGGRLVVHAGGEL